MTVAALVFDMDGVVVDSVQYWSDLRETVVETELGLPNVDVSALVGMNAADEYDFLARSHDVACSREAYVDAVHDRAAEIYRERVTLLDGLEECLTAAHRRGVSVGLVSAAYRRRVDIVVDRFDLAQCFDFVVAGDEVPGPSKPDPAIYQHAVDELGVEPSRAVAIEDSEHGVAAATAAGLYCLGYDHHPDQTLDRADERLVEAEALTRRVLALLDGDPASQGPADPSPSEPN